MLPKYYFFKTAGRFKFLMNWMRYMRFIILFRLVGKLFWALSELEVVFDLNVVIFFLKINMKIEILAFWYAAQKKKLELLIWFQLSRVVTCCYHSWFCFDLQKIRGPKYLLFIRVVKLRWYFKITSGCKWKRNLNPWIIFVPSLKCGIGFCIFEVSNCPVPI
jgi:hypothetical protein